MLIERAKVLKILNIFDLIKDKKFDIHVQYKLIKIKKAIEEERSIYQEQIQLNCDCYFEKDSLGRPIINSDGGYKIKQDKISECYYVIDQLNSCEVQVPDIYFSIDELIELNLSLEQLEILEPFIR